MTILTTWILEHWPTGIVFIVFGWIVYIVTAMSAKQDRLCRQLKEGFSNNDASHDKMEAKVERLQGEVSEWSERTARMEGKLETVAR